MSFGDYKSIQGVIKKYPLEIVNESFLRTSKLNLPELFLDNLNFALKYKTSYDSEYFLTENFIYPFLQFLWKQHDRLRVWSHQGLYYDDDLSGQPDYFISYWQKGVIKSLISTPLLAVVEAKKQNFDWGWGQCLAAMLACQKLNKDEDLVIYGIVSTGTIWEFAKLQGSKFTQHTFSYSLVNPQLLAGILDYVFSECEKEANKYQLKHKDSRHFLSR